MFFILNYLELIASTVSHLLATRFQSGAGTILARNRYDVDFNRLEDDDELEEPQEWHRVPTYNADVESIPATYFEKIFKLISSTPDMAILLWHQCIQGILFVLLIVIRLAINLFDLYYMIFILAFILISCPYATLMANTLSSTLWTADEIVSSMRCNSCFEHLINHWSPCIRKSSQINLHVELTSRSRQLWYLVMQFMKYVKQDISYRGDVAYEFLSEHPIVHHVYSKTSRKTSSNLPLIFQDSKIVTRG